MALGAAQILALALDPANRLRIGPSLTGILNAIFDPTANALRIKIEGYTLDATADPTVNEDLQNGFPIGSIFINTTTPEAFISLDSTNGAAVWQSMTAGAGGGGIALSDEVKSFSFSATKSIDFTIPVTKKTNLILGAKLWLNDPKLQTAILRNFTLSFWPNSSRLGNSLFLGMRGKNNLVYTQLSIATTGLNNEFTVDLIDNFTFDDPIRFLGGIVDGDTVGILPDEDHVIKDPNNVPPLADDTIGEAYPIDTGVSLVNQFKDTLFSDDALFIYGRLELSVNDTFDARLEMKIGGLG